MGKYCTGRYGWIGVYRVKQGCLVDFIKHLFFIINPSHVCPDHAHKWSWVENLHYIVNIQKTKSLRIYRLRPIRKTNALPGLLAAFRHYISSIFIPEYWRNMSNKCDWAHRKDVLCGNSPFKRRF